MQSILRALNKTAKNNSVRVETLRDNPKSKKWKEGGLALHMKWMERQKNETLYLCIFRPLAIMHWPSGWT